LTVRFVRHSDAPVRAVPVAAGARPPKRRRAAVAGFTGVAGQVAEIVTRRRRLLLLGLGDGHDWEAAGALAAARSPMAAHLAIDARGLPDAAATAMAVGAWLRAWQFDRLRTRPDRDHTRLTRLDILVDGPGPAAAWPAVDAALQGTLFARDLVAEPGNLLTPQLFAARLARLEREGVTVEVLDAAALEQEGLRAILAVGGASIHPPCMAVLRWRGTLPGPPLALVGKGVCFDMGGVSIKPAAGLWEMRTDMAGAAACAGAMLTLALRGSPTPVVAVLPLAENMLGARSYRPGDVLRTYDGTTVEVVDTDAEGRLLLADALAWTVANVQPAAIVDLATLTGSVMVALGQVMGGLFGNDAALAAHVAAAGAAVGEPVWPLPPGHADMEVLQSDIADIRQCSTDSRVPDAIHAAAFLRRFVGDTPWAHLDIAGMETRAEATDRHAAGATGFGVRLLNRLVMQRFEAAP